MINGYDLASRDNGSPSDPYLILKCNGKTFNERDIYQLDTSEPDFYKRYEFEGVFPGSTPLEIGAWDFDHIFGDDLIGTTIVDLEDRYFSMEWQNLLNKPIESRQLYCPSSEVSQGVLRMWIQLNSVNLPPDKATKWDISQKPPEMFEVRICALNCKDVKCMDWEGTSDVYMRGFFEPEEA